MTKYVRRAFAVTLDCIQPSLYNPPENSLAFASANTIGEYGRDPRVADLGALLPLGLFVLPCGRHGKLAAGS